jgi:hypothetical protein
MRGPHGIIVALLVGALGRSIRPPAAADVQDSVHLRSSADGDSAAKGSDRDVIKFIRNRKSPAHRALSSLGEESCGTPPGFELINCNNGVPELRPERGDWVHGSVSASEADFVTKVAAFVKKYNLSIAYDVGSLGGHVGHLAALFHVVPGKFISLVSADPPFDAESSALLPRAISETVEEVTPDALASLLENPKQIVVSLSGSPIESLARTDISSRSKLGLGLNEFDWLGYRQIIYLPRDESEFQFWSYYFDLQRDSDMGKEDSEILQDVLSRHVIRVAARPFQDMQFSRYLQAHRYAEPNVVLSKVREDVKSAHQQAACLNIEGGCKGVVLIDIPATLDRQKESGSGSCALDQGALKSLMLDWKVIIHLAPSCDIPDQPLPSVYVNSPVDGLSLLDFVTFADAVVTFRSDSLVTILGARIDVPIVRVLPDIDKYYLVMNRVFNSSMGRVVPAVDSRLPDALDEAVAQMRDHRDEVLRERAGYAQRYWWRVDGYEEYRVALQLLALSAPEAPESELGELLVALQAFTKIPPRPPSLYGANYPPSKMFFSANARNSMVWSAVRKAFFEGMPSKDSGAAPAGTAKLASKADAN